MRSLLAGASLLQGVAGDQQEFDRAVDTNAPKRALQNENCSQDEAIAKLSARVARLEEMIAAVDTKLVSDLTLSRLEASEGRQSKEPPEDERDLMVIMRTRLAQMETRLDILGDKTALDRFERLESGTVDQAVSSRLADADAPRPPTAMTTLPAAVADRHAKDSVLITARIEQVESCIANVVAKIDELDRSLAHCISHSGSVSLREKAVLEARYDLCESSATTPNTQVHCKSRSTDGARLPVCQPSSSAAGPPSISSDADISLEFRKLWQDEHSLDVLHYRRTFGRV